VVFLQQQTYRFPFVFLSVFICSLASLCVFVFLGFVPTLPKPSRSHFGSRSVLSTEVARGLVVWLRQ
jgi:hypothetical protein